MDNETLKGLQKVEAQILYEIDLYCKKNNIDYSLYGGTLIGAVRHKGFIPWDDDIDIVMTRSNYTKFCDSWAVNPIEGFYLENYETDRNTQNTHAKIRKNGTLLLSDAEDENVGNHGIWIDIFVMDKIKNDDSGRRTLRLGRKMILMAKANGYLPGESLIKRITRGILKLRFPKDYRYKKLQQIASYLRSNDLQIVNDFYLCDMCTIPYLDVKFPENTGLEYKTIQFEGNNYKVFSNYEDILKIMYGDYMQLPPVEERVCRHNPKKINLG